MIPIAEVRALVVQAERLVAQLARVLPRGADPQAWGLRWRRQRLGDEVADMHRALDLLERQVDALDARDVTLYRRTDEVHYCVSRERMPRILQISHHPDISVPLPLGQMIGTPVRWAALQIEPDQTALVEQILAAIQIVRPGDPQMFHFRSTWFGGNARILEVFDRGLDAGLVYAVSYQPDPRGILGRAADGASDHAADGPRRQADHPPRRER
jgi:hypothetical protein